MPKDESGETMSIVLADLQELRKFHAENSVLREKIVEHIFISDILRLLWKKRIIDVEVMQSEFDAGGYDLVLGYKNIVRHIQFKTVLEGGANTRVSISLKLAEKPSGCVIWTVVNPELKATSYLWFGGMPNEPLPSIDGLKITKHTKGNSLGEKAERVNHRTLNMSQFKRLSSPEDVLRELFGEALNLV